MQSRAPIRIYHIEGRRSFRVVWMCEELGLPYELAFKPGELFGSMADIRKANPSMPMAPSVEIDGEMWVESGAILEVLAARHAPGVLIPPVESPDYPRHAQWMHFAEGSAMARFAMDMFVAMMKGARVDDLPQTYDGRVDPPDCRRMVGSAQVFRYADEYLGRQPYFGGSVFTAADIMMQFSLRAAKATTAQDAANYPNIIAWLARVEARPAYARAVQRAMPRGMNDSMQVAGESIPIPIHGSGIGDILKRRALSLFFSVQIWREALKRYGRALRSG